LFGFLRFQRKGKLCFRFSPIPKKRETKNIIQIVYVFIAFRQVHGFLIRIRFSHALGADRRLNNTFDRSSKTQVVQTNAYDLMGWPPIVPPGRMPRTHRGLRLGTVPPMVFLATDWKCVAQICASINKQDDKKCIQTNRSSK
jgi:hypothetical protein